MYTVGRQQKNQLLGRLGSAVALFSLPIFFDVEIGKIIRVQILLHPIFLSRGTADCSTVSDSLFIVYVYGYNL